MVTFGFVVATLVPIIEIISLYDVDKYQKWEAVAPLADSVPVSDQAFRILIVPIIYTLTISVATPILRRSIV
jgi:hypothetical protein